MNSKPPIAGESDREYQTRIDADRVTEQWKHAVSKPQSRTEGPLYRWADGQTQRSLLFGDEPICFEVSK